MMRRSLLLLAAIASAFTLSASAQAPNAAAIMDSIGASAARVKKLQWTQLMVLSVDGVVTLTSISECKPPWGSVTVHCSEYELFPSEPPNGSPDQKKRMEGAIAEFKAYLDSAKTLLDEYLPPAQAKIAAAMKTGHLVAAPNRSDGTNTLTISNYTKLGDRVAIVVGAKESHLRSVAINTWLNDPKAVVTVAVNYNDGALLPKNTTLTVTAKHIVVVVTDSPDLSLP